MNPEAWVLLSRATLYTTAALLVCLLLRRPLRKRAGAGAAYAIWSCVPLALVAALLPGPSLGIAVPGFPALTAMPALSSVHGEGRAWATWLAAAWLGGAVVMAIGLWTRQRRFMRSLGTLHRLDDRLWSAARDAGLPASLGLWRPRIVLPADFSERYNADERALILAHERMHLRRGDLHANLLAALMLCIGWFNPLMHLGWRAFRLDQELACDAAVLAQHPGKRRSYATAMLKTQLGRDFTPLACHWAASHPLAQRIAALRGSPVAAGRARWRVAMVLLLAATISTAAWSLQPARIALAAQPALAAGNAVDFAMMQPPRYPAAAFDGGIEGFVELQIDIDSAGRPQHIDIVQSRPAGVFDQAVLEAARQWRLKPVYVHGKRIASTVRVPVKFELDGPEQTSTDAAAARSEAPASNRLSVQPPCRLCFSGLCKAGEAVMQSSATSKTTAQLSGGRAGCPGLACAAHTRRFLRAGHAHPTTARHVLSAFLAPTCAAILALSLGACATQGGQEQQRSQREDSVDQRMLSAQPGGNGGGSIQSYTLAPAQRFRIPRALRSDAPVLPADSPRQSLPPTTVCAHVILNADGAVQRVDPMSDRDECAAGLLPDNADLVQSVRTTVQQWQFVPAALCTFAAGVAQPAALDDCSGAISQQPVPVTLSFAFTFEVRQGKVSVRTGKVAR